MENPFNTEQNKPKRSTLLIVLVILTLLNNVPDLFSNVRSLLNIDAAVIRMEASLDDLDDSMEILGSSGFFADVVNFTTAVTERIIDAIDRFGAFYFIVMILIGLVITLGAILMLRLDKRGFHLYAGGQLAGLIVPYIFGLTNFTTTVFVFLNIFSVLLVALFIWLYARALKVFEKPVEE